MDVDMEVDQPNQSRNPIPNVKQTERNGNPFTGFSDQKLPVTPLPLPTNFLTKRGEHCQQESQRESERLVSKIDSELKKMSLKEKTIHRKKHDRGHPYASDIHVRSGCADLLLYRPLKRALQEWVDASENKDQTKKIANEIFQQNIGYSKPTRFIISPYSDRILEYLDSLPNLTKSTIKEVSLRSVKISTPFFDCLPCGLVSLNLAYTALKTSINNIPHLLCRLVNLETLELQGNKLKDLPIFSLNHVLKKLDISNNEICDSSQEKKTLLCYPFLSYLDLSNNPLGYIPLCSNTLTTLLISNINLQDDGVIVLRELYRLEVLDISNNCLTILPEISSKNIRNLNLKNNQLQNKDDEISLEKFPHLVYLELSGNQLTNIPPINNNVQYLYLNDNQIVSNTSVLRLEDLNSLLYLELKNNYLTNLPFNFSCNLRTINVSGNHITDYDRTKRMRSNRLHIILTNNPIAQQVSKLQILAVSSA